MNHSPRNITTSGLALGEQIGLNEGQLTPAGIAKRDWLLGELHGALAHRRRIRLASRAATTLALIGGVAAGAWLVAQPAHVPIPDGPETAAVERSGANKAPTNTVPRGLEAQAIAHAAATAATVNLRPNRPRIEIVAADLGIMARLAVPADAPSRVELIDDAALVESFAARGESVGVARVAGRAVLIANSR